MGIQWQFIAEKVQGASHKRKNTVCQDNYMIRKGEEFLVIAVADGHGSKNHFRSDMGSFLACQIAADLGAQYAESVFSKENTSVIEDIANNKFKTDIVAQWQKAVMNDLKIVPLTEEQLILLNISKEKYDILIERKQQDTMLENRSDFYKLLSVYGSTLLVTLVMKHFILFWQLGDGDILLYYRDKKQIVNPIPGDARLIANETTSICSKEAVLDMRFVVKYLYDTDNEPDAIMMTTDGYSNSFADYKDFEKVLMDYDEMLRDDDKLVSAHIEEWLDETSKDGSGDDITLVLAWKK